MARRYTFNSTCHPWRAEQREAREGTQVVKLIWSFAAHACLVFAAWVPFPSLRSAGDDSLV